MSSYNNEVYKFEHYILSASYEMLSKQGITSLPIQRDSNNLTSPRVELQAVMGTPTGHVKILSGSVRNDSWNGQFNAICYTDRIENHSSHSVFVARVMDILGDSNNWNSGSWAYLPYHSMGSIDHRQTAVSVDAEDGKDISALAFGFQIWIRPNSWTPS